MQNSDPGTGFQLPGCINSSILRGGTLVFSSGPSLQRRVGGHGISSLGNGLVLWSPFTWRHFRSAPAEHICFNDVRISTCSPLVCSQILMGSRFYGVTLAQTIRYARLYPSDRLFLKVLVRLLPLS